MTSASAWDLASCSSDSDKGAGLEHDAWDIGSESDKGGDIDPLDKAKCSSSICDQSLSEKGTHVSLHDDPLPYSKRAKTDLHVLPPDIEAPPTLEGTEWWQRIMWTSLLHLRSSLPNVSTPFLYEDYCSGSLGIQFGFQAGSASRV
jgi:hypothetical protein